MRKEKYKKELNIIEEIYSEAKKKLAKEYAFSNNPYKVGDVIQTHFETGKIVNIKWSYGYIAGLPSFCVYKCENITKKGTINKRKPFCCIYQTDIKD